MRVSVRLLGPYKRLAGGVGDVEVEVLEPTLGGVLDAICAMYPEAGKKLMPTARSIEPAVRIVLNDGVLQGATVDVAVRDGDRVAFVPIMGGLISLLMMAGLPGDTWLRLIIWLVIGMFIYFFYGRYHSRVQNAGGPQPGRPVEPKVMAD